MIADVLFEYLLTEGIEWSGYSKEMDHVTRTIDSEQYPNINQHLEESVTHHPADQLVKVSS